MKIPFKNNSFQAITSGFGVRNFESINTGLSEMHRVLDKDGKPTGETEYVILNPKDGTKIVMDYDNKDWWHRTVLETQAIIDAGSGVDGQLIDVIIFSKLFLITSSDFFPMTSYFAK